MMGMLLETGLLLDEALTHEKLVTMEKRTLSEPYLLKTLYLTTAGKVHQLNLVKEVVAHRPHPPKVLLPREEIA